VVLGRAAGGVIGLDVPVGISRDRTPGSTVTGDSQRGGAEDAIRNDLRTGETLEDAFHVGEAAVGVTGQRLLVRQAGRTRAADLTNVRTVHLRTVQERHRLTSAGLWGGVALLSAVAWLYAPL
jgi:hypothetical protein